MEKPKLIYSKIPKIMGLIGAIGKDKKNSMQGYKFRGIDDVYNSLNKHLASECVFCTSEITERTREERKTKNGGTLFYTTLRMNFTFYAEDGSFVTSTTEGEAMDSSDKSTNKAMSVAYKYALMQIFCIPTEEEKDTEHRSPVVISKEKTSISAKQRLQFTDKLLESSKDNINKYLNQDKLSIDEVIERIKKFYIVTVAMAEKIKSKYAPATIPKKEAKEVAEVITKLTSDEMEKLFNILNDTGSAEELNALNDNLKQTEKYKRMSKDQVQEIENFIKDKKFIIK